LANHAALVTGGHVFALHMMIAVHHYHYVITETGYCGAALLVAHKMMLALN
jgi:hypothetical protein